MLQTLDLMVNIQKYAFPWIRNKTNMPIIINPVQNYIGLSNNIVKQVNVTKIGKKWIRKYPQKHHCS